MQRVRVELNSWSERYRRRRLIVASCVWSPIKRAICERIGEEVTLEVRMVFPADILPDQPPRVLAHRCSRGIECNLFDKPSCCWAGTLPEYDPFS